MLNGLANLAPKSLCRAVDPVGIYFLANLSVSRLFVHPLQ
ncbi:hypothetical protein FHT02_003668 [Sphingomonas xinjiangensis]|uniref:Uncharacterized protein n=1 Tax=Sphingomonas xinjiangensis TaxID=643568 RepID=A0A840YRV9_9SPHN|nr:hypothetical protein [Sphingomonas xinjiangensis]